MIRRTVLSSPTNARSRQMSATSIPVAFWPQATRSPVQTRLATSARIPVAPAPAVDLFTADDRAVLRAALPGVHPEQIEVSVYRNTVAIRAEQPSAPSWESDQISWQIAELGHGPLERTVRLPFQIEEQQVEAQFANGMLQLTLPRIAADQPYRIPVKVGPELTPELDAGEREDETFAAD